MTNGSTTLLEGVNDKLAFLDANKDTSSTPGELLRSLRERIAAAGDQDWRIPLFEVIAAWPLAQETVGDARHVYLIGGEAFDWRALAERLLRECGDIVSENAREALILGPDPPEGLTEEDFRRTLGMDKHRAHLNYVYGVVVENALVLAVDEEIRKRRFSNCFQPNDDHTDAVYRTLYDAPLRDLVEEFLAVEPDAAVRRRRKSVEDFAALSLHGSNAFTYWLFKRRFKIAEPARFASDTRKALDQLERMRLAEEARTAAARRQGLVLPREKRLSLFAKRHRRTARRRVAARIRV